MWMIAANTHLTIVPWLGTNRTWSIGWCVVGGNMHSSIRGGSRTSRRGGPDTGGVLAPDRSVEGTVVFADLFDLLGRVESPSVHPGAMLGFAGPHVG
jgi:hypothetical protein